MADKRHSVFFNFAIGVPGGMTETEMNRRLDQATNAFAAALRVGEIEFLDTTEWTVTPHPDEPVRHRPPAVLPAGNEYQRKNFDEIVKERGVPQDEVARALQDIRWKEGMFRYLVIACDMLTDRVHLKLFEHDMAMKSWIESKEAKRYSRTAYYLIDGSEVYIDSGRTPRRKVWDALEIQYGIEGEIVSDRARSQIDGPAFATIQTLGQQYILRGFSSLEEVEEDLDVSVYPDEWELQLVMDLEQRVTLGFTREVTLSGHSQDLARVFS